VGPVAPLSSLSPTEALPTDSARSAEDKSMGRVPLLRCPAQDHKREDVQLPALDFDYRGVVHRASRRWERPDEEVEAPQERLERDERQEVFRGLRGPRGLGLAPN